MGLALIGDGEGVDPGEGLGDGLDLDEIEGETGFVVDEAGAEGLAGIIEIEGGGVETVAGGLGGDVGEGGGVGGVGGCVVVGGGQHEKQGEKGEGFHFGALVRF